MKKMVKTAPAVFAVGNEYQIIVPVSCETVAWVKVGESCYYDDSNGILRSARNIHKMNVPMAELDKAGEYTVCLRRVIKRKAYFSLTCAVNEEKYQFFPVKSENPVCYHIADAHNMIDSPVAAAKRFEKEIGEMDFLILNGDIPEDSSSTKHFETIYKIASEITGGRKPVVFSRGNHDTRGVFAENIADYTPCLNGNSFFSFRLGGIWGLVIDCGEDKPDNHKEYGNMVCCEAFRKRETSYIKSVIENAQAEYNAEGVEKRIIVAHNPFTRSYAPPFNIEEDTYACWAKLLKDNIKPDIMICGHTHKFSINEVGGEKDAFGQPCAVVVASQVDKRKSYFAGAGFVFNKDSIDVIFNDRDSIIEKHTI